jgi:hypothetical protein
MFREWEFYTHIYNADQAFQMTVFERKSYDFKRRTRIL